MYLFQLLLFCALCGPLETIKTADFVTSDIEQLVNLVNLQNKELMNCAEIWSRQVDSEKLPQGIQKIDNGVLVKPPYPYFDVATNFVSYAMIHWNQGQKNTDLRLMQAGLSEEDIAQYRQAILGLTQDDVLKEIRISFKKKRSLQSQGKTLADLSNDELGALLLSYQQVRQEVNTKLFARAFVQLGKQTQKAMLQHLQHRFSNQTYQIQVKPTIESSQREDIIAGLKMLLFEQ